MRGKRKPGVGEVSRVESGLGLGVGGRSDEGRGSWFGRQWLEEAVWLAGRCAASMTGGSAGKVTWEAWARSGARGRASREGLIKLKSLQVTG